MPEKNLKAEMPQSLETRVAVLTEKVVHITERQEKDMIAFNERQSAHHENVKRIGNDINLLRLDVQSWSAQTKQVVDDHKDMKKVIDNNTQAFQEMKEMVQKLCIEKENTKSNISTLAKIILWGGGIIGMIYGAFVTAVEWLKDS